MSLANTTVKASYAGDGVNNTFAIPFDPIRNDSTETFVYIRDESVDPATETLQVEGVLNDYVLSGAPDSEAFDVNVVFNFGNTPTADQKVIIIRVTPLVQPLQLTSVGYVPLAAIEKNFDSIVAMIQEINERLSRVPVLPVTEQVSDAGMQLPEPGASTVIGWNAAGTALRIYTIEEFLGAYAPPTGVFTWTDYATRWDTAPTFNKVIAGGSVYNYILEGVTRYRYVPTTYNAAQDAFYASFNDMTDTLTTLIVARGF